MSEKEKKIIETCETALLCIICGILATISTIILFNEEGLLKILFCVITMVCLIFMFYTKCKTNKCLKELYT